MSSLKDEFTLKGEKEPVAVVVTGTLQNDSRAGLMQMYADLTPLADQLKSSATLLFIFSLFYFCTLEGMFGLIAASGVLFCAAPGALGTAYAARCTRVCAILCAGLSLGHLCAIMVVMSMLPAIYEKSDMCSDARFEHMPHPPPVAMGTWDWSTDAFAESVSTAGRKLSVAMPAAMPAAFGEVECEEMSSFFQKMAPVIIMSAAAINLCLFISAVKTAKRAALLVREARRMGANAI